MGQKKITDLQLIAALSATANFVVDNGIQTYRSTANQIFDFVRSKFATIRTISAAGVSLVASDVTVLLDPTSASFTQMLPAVASLGAGTVWSFKNVASNGNAVTLDANSSELIDTAETLVLESGDAVTLFNNGSRWIILEANLTVRRNRIIASERIPQGVVWPYTGFDAPTGFLGCDGSALSRTTYASLFSAINKTIVANTTSGSTSISFTQPTQGLGLYQAIGGPGIPYGAYIASIPNSSSVVLSAAATATASNVNLLLSPHGLGDGSTTFNIPDTRGIFIRGMGYQAISGVGYGDLGLGIKGVDTLMGHWHRVAYGNGGGGNSTPNSVVNDRISGTNSGQLFSMTATELVNGGWGVPRVGIETRPAHIVLNHIIKY